MSQVGRKSDTIGARRDRLRLTLWGAPLVLDVAALVLDLRRVGPSARATAGPFLTAGVGMAAGAILDRVGLLRLLVRGRLLGRVSRRRACVGLAGSLDVV